MLRIVSKMSDLRFSDLMQVYIKGNRENGKIYHNQTAAEQLRSAENDFYHYLNSVFFKQPDSFYCIWEDGGAYKAALRLEPYQDGYLLCALETAPEARRQGYATTLIAQTIACLAKKGDGIVYSHISKGNTRSLCVHKKCGFEIIKDYARYSDGSVLHNHYTLSYSYKKSEI